MKNKTLGLLSLLISFFLIFSILSPISVFAEEDIDSSTPGVKTVQFSGTDITIDGITVGMGGSSGDAVKSGNITWAGGKLQINNKGEIETLLKVDTSSILVNPNAFKNCKDSDVTKAMRLFVDGLTNCGGNADTIQQIMADIQDVDTSVSSVMLPLIFESTKGDMYQAYKITSPFLNLLSIVLGVGAVILILLLLFSTVMDLAYIGLPVWREAQQSKNGNNGKNPFGVSYEALTTVKEVEKGLGGGDGGYRNAYLLYFRRRALTYIILAICIMYLICGGLSGIIGFVLSLVSGITG